MKTTLFVAVLFSTFLFSIIDPTGIFFALAGLAVGLAIHSLIRYVRTSRTRKERLRLLFMFVFVALAGIGSFELIMFFAFHRFDSQHVESERPPRQSDIRFDLIYSCRLKYDDKNNLWIVTDILNEPEINGPLFPKATAGDLAVISDSMDDAKLLVADHLKKSGWFEVNTNDGKLGFVRERKVSSSNRLYPLKTVNSISVLTQNSTLLETDGQWVFNGKELTSVAATYLVVGNPQSAFQNVIVWSALRPPPKIRALAVYTDLSTATIIAPNGLVRNTYPKYTSQVERLENNDVEITLPLKPMWSGESTLRLEQSSPLLRNKAVEWVYDMALLPLSKWIIASIFAMVALGTKDKWLIPFVNRLLRRLGITWQWNEGKTAAS